MLPVRPKLESFALTVSVSDVLPIPEEEDKNNHEALTVAVQRNGVEAVSSIRYEPPSSGILVIEVGDTERLPPT